MAIKRERRNNKEHNLIFLGSSLEAMCGAGSGRPPGLSPRSAAEVPLSLRNLPPQGTAPDRGEEGIERVKVPGEKQKFGNKCVCWGEG